jgi:hypothetical protein
VFLTPLKPPTKASISLEAIQSCLYYLHVITPEDDEARISLEEQQKAEEAERLANTSPIHRKPLPLTPFANYPASQRPPTPPKSYPHFQPGLTGQSDDSQADRLAARGIHLRLNTRSDGDNGPVRRKPIGPRSIAITELDDATSVQRKPVGSPPDHQEQLNASRSDGRESWPRVAGEQPPALPPPPNRTSPTKKGSIQEADRIVLIRRDPASGSQWNVGTITVASSGLSSTVEIHTPGYQKFAKQDFERNSQPSEITQILQNPTSMTSASPIDRTVNTPHFLRTIDILALSQPKIGRSAYQRNLSEDMYSPREQESTQPQPVPKNNYIFTSPWQGQCFFTTGLDGRSLKCRHALPVASATGETSSETVCELRFNLPWLRIKKRNNQTQSEGENSPGSRIRPKGAEAKEAFRRSMQRLRSGSGSKMISGLSEDQRLHTDFENIKAKSNAADQQDRMDLSLGQEKAGGGFRGSSAKLGKLIIENEGLKFCDLAVGACMSIWWTHYSSSGEAG